MSLSACGKDLGLGTLATNPSLVAIVHMAFRSLVNPRKAIPQDPQKVMILSWVLLVGG